MDIEQILVAGIVLGARRATRLRDGITWRRIVAGSVKRSQRIHVSCRRSEAAVCERKPRSWQNRDLGTTPIDGITGYTHVVGRWRPSERYRGGGLSRRGEIAWSGWR